MSVIKRIDDLVSLCTKDVDDVWYAQVKIEVKNLILQTVGRGDIYSDFEKIVTEESNMAFVDCCTTRWCYSKCRNMIGVLLSLKNAIQLQEKKYQIFISSTYKDLINYRRVVADEIAFCGHIPAGMEDFTACGEDLETYIKHVIDESDYYVLIIGQRFGSSIPMDENISYTMMEYEYAKSKGMRIIPFIYNGTHVLDGNDLDVNRDKFDKFVSQVSKSVPQYFKDKNELARKLTKALDNEMKNHPQRGWIRL